MTNYGSKSSGGHASGLPHDAARSTQLTNPGQMHAACYGQSQMIVVPYTPTTFRNTGPYAGH